MGGGNTKLALLGLILLSFNITSCKNFLSGDNLLDELNNSVEYANAPYADITFNSINAATESIIPSLGNYNNQYKATDSIKLTFTPTPNYQFIKWTATPSQTVTFADETSLTTTAKILSSDTPIKIEPLCLKRSEVTFDPSNVLVQPKNSAISIHFSNPIEATAEDLDKISITMDSLSIKEYYQAPQISNDKQTITFIPKRDKLLDTISGSEIKVITVTIPGTFYYIKDGNKISLKDDINYSFKINSTTQEKATINFSCSSTEGDLSYSTRKEYNLDEEISSTCTPKEDYVVTGWNVLYLADKTPVEKSILFTETSSDNKTIKIKIITGTDKEITVFPICVLKDVTVVQFTADYGTTNPFEEKQYHENASFNISYRETSECQFTGWKVYDAANPSNEVTDVIKIANSKSYDTECTVLKAGTKVIIKAECTIRPSVLSTTPIYDANGVYRDRRIIVMFDKPMDESSIYYNSTEKQNLEAQGYAILTDNVHTSETCRGKAYGYWDGQDENTIHFKNISISLRRDESKNLLKHYNPPYFDDTDPTVLRIDPKNIEKQQDGTEIDLMPPAASDILVTISYNMGTKDSKSGDIITLTKNSRWNYYTNSKFDNEIPIFKDDFKVSFDIDNGQELTTDTSLFNKISGTETSNYKIYNIGNKNLRVTGTTFDNGSGIGSVKWSITRIPSNYYTTPTEEELPTGQIDDLLISGADAEFKTKDKNNTTSNTYQDGSIIDLKLDQQTEGLFRIDFVAYDKNELASETKSFYFVHDVVAPTLKTQSITECRKEAEKTTLSYAINEPDYWKAEVYTQETPDGEQNDWQDGLTPQSLERPAEYTKGTNIDNLVTGLTQGTKYQHKVVLVDYAGNKSEAIDVEIDNTAPTKISNFYAGARNKKIDLFYTTPANDDFAKIELSYGSVDTDTESISLNKSSNVSKQITGLTIGNSYSYYIRTVDYSGNKSEPVSVTQKEQVSIGNICYSVNGSSVICSNNYYSGSNIKPIGVICDITDYGNKTDYSKVRIWDLEEKTNLIWGSMDKPPYADHSDSTNDPHFYTKDGLATYNIYKNKYNGGTFQNSKSYWNWLDNTKNKNSTITWYIPTYNEISNFIVGNYNILKTTYDTLKSKGVSVTFTNSGALTTCIPGRYDNSNEKGYTRAFISYPNNKASISSDVTFRDGQSSTCHCMAQVNLN